MSEARHEVLGFAGEQCVHSINRKPETGNRTMSNRFKTAVIDDVLSANIDYEMQENL
jgi:hypothetical protein